MFRRTRLKIMIFITCTVMLILAGTVFAIYLSSYIEEYNHTVGQDKSGILELFEYTSELPGDLPDEPIGPPPEISEDGEGSIMDVQLSIIKRFVGVMIRNTFKIGIVIVLIVFVLSYFIAGWILKPLEESYKKQKKFISDAGHELKTPVAAIDANAELLYGDIGDNKWLQSIRYESGRMTELIRQLLDLARTESISIVKEKIDLSRLIMGSVLPYEGVAFEKGYAIETDIENDIFVQGSSSQLEQLTAILVDNAIDHAKGEGQIHISLKKEGKKAVLIVSNPGEALTDEDIKNLFERFYRADKAHSDTGHYGLGLSIAKSIVTTHKGTIGVNCIDGKVIFTVKL
ncbi:MAG: HAMP domain-containing histidine kinase [Butyrivibrio sp.]|uniref:sensor histidine kinase n=1 Tax=Butyrivibrio sp. TaxID=28121 RepID=UPI0025DCDB80|nr:HAMP domain-containing sensor histidine kinase [Butyrivibrio sp.]MCR5770278.1 HAMP domain-containing histidine kinase [Butyrivibrio sp.]